MQAERIGLLILMLPLTSALFIPYLLYDYVIEAGHIKTRIFGITVVTIATVDIVSISKLSWAEVVLRPAALKLGNRPFAPGVLIRKKTGLFRNVIMTPPDTDGFIEQIRRTLV